MSPFPKTFSGLSIKYAKLFIKPLLLLLGLMILAAIFENLNIRLFANITGSLKTGYISNYDEMMWLLLLFSASVILGIFFSNMSSYFLETHLTIQLKCKMEEDLFQYLLGHSYDFIINRQSGMIITEKEQVKKLPELLDPLFYIIEISLDLMMKVILLTIISPLIGILYLCAILLVLLPEQVLDKNIKRVGALRAKMTAIRDGRILDIVNNLNLIKQYDTLEYEKKKLHVLFKQDFDVKQKNMKAWMGQFTLTGIVVDLVTFFILLIAVYLWSVHKIQTSDIVYILITLTKGLNWIAGILDNFIRLRLDVSSITQGLEPFVIPHQIVDKDNAKDFKNKGGEIEFRNVCFGYNKKKMVFNNFSLLIKSHEKIGIVGYSGGGKSTLVNLLQRAYEIENGEILIDGQNIKDITQESLHKNISVIPQDTLLFNRTIYDNIAFGADDVTPHKLKGAAKKAMVDDFISSKEKGYDDFVGDKGCKLSGGERQRIAIARAILKKAPILILDEATSALDSESETIISKAIENIIDNQTVIMIAHRLSTLKNMDRIIVLKQGKIIEQGNFKELLQMQGIFYKLYSAQEIQKRRK